MTLDEAIEHAEERTYVTDPCAKDHAQWADWLRELRRARMEIDLLKTLRDGFKADAQKYKAENAKLRKLCVDLYRCSDPCNDCPHYNGSNDGFYCDLGVGWKARRMRELGIEVE